MSIPSTATALRGASFLLHRSTPQDTFIPEEINEEQQMIVQMCHDFIQTEIDPHKAKIEKQQDQIAADLLEKMGELGLLGTHMPESYGGSAMDTNTNTLLSEVFGPVGSFSVAITAHTGIGMLPILYFGTDAQKDKYLPDLITGKLKASYCLTEPGSGSDALAAKTRADLNAEGTHYILNGQKMWITNAGFADIFIVFAKIGGDKFTGFIVEGGAEGLTLGAEEDKLGIKGSSTRQVFFENVKVPVENVLGEIGKGHHIAFNVLNIGRFKLGVLCTGGAKNALTLATQYANERHQFNQPIANFGAIQHKLAEMAIQIFASESAVYRTSHLMHLQKLKSESEGKSYAEAMLVAAEEYAIECSILKVVGSEALDFAVDENVQVHGGVGFSEEYQAARAYRDARINRIFEGTNEINRLLMVDMLFKRTMKGDLPMVDAVLNLADEFAGSPKSVEIDGAYGAAESLVENIKKMTLLVANAAISQQMKGELNLKEDQEIVMNFSDMISDCFTAESMLLRVMKLAEMQQKPQEQSTYDDILAVYLYDTVRRMQKNATDALAAMLEGAELETALHALNVYAQVKPLNVKTARRKIASRIREANAWCF